MKIADDKTSREFEGSEGPPSQSPN